MYILVLIALLLTGCSPRYADFFPYYDNGTKKPCLTLLPVYDEIGSEQKFATDLTSSIRNRLKRKGKLFVPPQEKMQKVLVSLPEKELVTSRDLKPFTRFQGSDYVCLMELSEMKILPYKRGTIKPLYIADIPEDAAKVLAIAVKLKIVDIRGPTPKLVRHELVQSNHMVTVTELKGELAQQRSRLARDLAEKIEETLCLRK